MYKIKKQFKVSSNLRARNINLDLRTYTYISENLIYGKFEDNYIE